MSEETEEIGLASQKKARDLLSLIDTYFEAKQARIVSKIMLLLVPGNSETREYVEKTEKKLIPEMQMKIQQEFERFYEAVKKISDEE